LSSDEGEDDVDDGIDEVAGSILANGWEAGSVTTVDDTTVDDGTSRRNERSIPSTTAADDTSTNEISIPKIDRTERRKMHTMKTKRIACRFFILVAGAPGEGFLRGDDADNDGE
jgi:hypothetical protein